MFELKLPVHTITISDTESGEVVTLKTVRTAKEIAGYIEEMESEALEEAIYRLREQYRTPRAKTTPRSEA
jgi:hypothetical protein